MGRVLNAIKDQLAGRGRRDVGDEYVDLRNEAKTDVRHVWDEHMGARDPLAVYESLKDEGRPKH